MSLVVACSDGDQIISSTFVTELVEDTVIISTKEEHKYVYTSLGTKAALVTAADAIQAEFEAFHANIVRFGRNVIAPMTV